MIPFDQASFYFGCVGEVCHYLWDERLTSHRWGDATRLPWLKIDCALCPPHKQIEGEAALHHKDGWTALAFLDRSVDHRPGSNSVFIFRGELTFDEAVARAKGTFPSVWGRFTFEVREADA